jgi:single-stranded DNA-binding protein
MTLYLLATGTLTADPIQRTSQTGNVFATGSLRVATEDGVVFVSLIAFADQAERLLVHRQGSAIAAAGRAKMAGWTGKDGAERHGLSIVAEQIASVAAAQRADRDRRSARAADKSLFDEFGR